MPVKSPHLSAEQSPEQVAALTSKRIAVVFPGQGSQSVGMLTELAAQYPIVEQTYVEASDALGFDLWALSQDEDKLGQTQFTQPTLLTGSMAIWRILQQEIALPVTYLAGHSLGEYSALCASGVVSLADAVQVVHQRGKLMQQAVTGVDVGMAAILGLEGSQVVSICDQVCELNDAAIVSAANFNSPNQVVVAGNMVGVSAVVEQVKAMGKKAIPLKVSVPSHCDLMQPASDDLSEALNSISFNQPSIPVIQNRYAKEEETTADIKQALIMQLCKPVLWSQTMQFFADKHINLIIECGAGNVLSNLSKRQATPIVSYPTDKPVRLNKLMEALT